jgi:hypothetical protein
MSDDEIGLEQRLRERFAAIPARLPGEIADAVSGVTATRQKSRFNPIIPVLVVAAALGIGAVTVLGGAVRFNPVAPPPPSLASNEGTASPSTANPSTAKPAPEFAPGTVVRATADLSLEAVGGWTIYAGQKAFVVEIQHASGEGAPRYLLQTWGDLTTGIKPDTVFGHIDAPKAEAHLVEAPPLCPTGEPTLADIAQLEPFERLVCFGSRELTFGPVTASDHSIGPRTSTRWLSTEGRPDFFTGLPYYRADASVDVADGDFVMVTGHFDEPSSLDCGDVAEVTWCRQRFFITTVTAAEPPAFVLRGTWRQIALPPISGRNDHRVVWTGSEVLVWGGFASDQEASVFDASVPRGGAAYDPEADSWRVIPDAPIAGRGSPIVVWSGTEMLVFGGAAFDAAGEQPVLDGAAYDPATDRWRALPPAPLSGGATVGGWLAGRFVVVTNDAAAAYDPVVDRWTELPAAPIRPGWRTAVVAADRLVVIAFGDGATPPVQEATLDPTSWTWASADLTVDPLMAGIDFVGIGDRILSPSTGMTFDPVTRTWGSVTTCDRVWGGVWTGVRVIGVQGAWDAATDTCLDVPPSPPREPPFNDTNGREFAVAVWTGEELITWSGGTGGDIMWMPRDGAAFRPHE